MNKKTIFLVFLLVIVTPLLSVKAETLNQKLKGRILLQVEQKGEAWFVSPGNQKRHFLGRPADAFRVMRELGLGISNTDFIRFERNMPEKLLGKIIIKIEDSGKAYYIFPVDKKPYFLGKPADAFRVMRELGLGITDLNLKGIIEDDSSRIRRQRAQEEANKPAETNNNNNNNNNNSSSSSSSSNSNNIPETPTASTTDDTQNATTSPEITGTTTEITTPLTGSASCKFLAEYFKKETISGAPNSQETVQGIDFDWGAGSPEALDGFNDKFSVHYTGKCFFEAGTYDFTGTFNDGIEATLDDQWLIKSWKNRNITATETKTLEIKEGYHDIKINYYDHLSDATLKLDWTKQ